MTEAFPMTLAMFSTWHIVAVLVVVLLLFGGKKVPELARGIGRGLRIFRDEMHGLQQDVEPPAKVEDPPKASAGTTTVEKK